MHHKYYLKDKKIKGKKSESFMISEDIKSSTNGTTGTCDLQIFALKRIYNRDFPVKVQSSTYRCRFKF